MLDEKQKPYHTPDRPVRRRGPPDAGGLRRRPLL